MNIGLCNALGQAAMLYNDLIEKVFLQCTNMDDKMFAAVLEGLSE